jgi:hypothetical protein
MGDREKGELAAGAAVMPEANAACCARHLHKNMLRQHIVRKKGDGLWQSVARAATMEERDALWNLLCTTSPRQAVFLDQIPKTMWQTCEMLAAGCQTHFTVTNNMAETLGSRLLVSDYGQEPIRYRTAGPMIHGLMTMFAKQSKDLQAEAAKLHKDGIKYSDYALTIVNRETIEAEHYSAVQVGPREWAVRRMGIVTDKVRHVTYTAEAGLVCPCQLYAECAIACRHMRTVSRVTRALYHLLDTPCGDLWQNSRFVQCFRDFEVRMPTAEDTRSTVLVDFPANIGLPPTIKTRGRPRVKRIKQHGPRRNVSTPGIKCGLCGVAGHVRATCPVRLRYKV